MQSQITSTTPNEKAQRKIELKLADNWIRRWVRFSRKGMPKTGYPKRAVFADSTWYHNPDSEPTYHDELVKDVLDSYQNKPRQILLDYYYMELSMAETAIKNGLSKAGVQWRLDAIRNKILMVLKSA